MPPNFKFSTLASRQPVSRRILAKAVKKRCYKLSDSSLDVPISVLVRNYNEAEDLTKLLKGIRGQIYKAPIQIVLQDNGSTDGSLKIAEKYGATIAPMAQEEFTYPKGLNVGMEKAEHEVVIITVAHALPTHNYWLRVAAQDFADSKVAGVYGPQTINENSKFNEIFLRPATLVFRYTKTIKKIRLGVLGATACAVRRSLWEQQPFDEAYEVGAEDTIWADWAIGHGYIILRDQLFAAHHSHGASFIENMGELKRYNRMLKEPQSIHNLSPYTKRRFNKDE